MKKLTAALILLAAAALAGCQNHGDSTSVSVAPNAPRPVAAPSAKPAATDSTKLISGAAPLTFVLGAGGPVRIVDTTAGKTLVAVTAAPAAVIRVDAAKGISIANHVVQAGPLPSGHRYEIWLDRH